MFHKSLNEFIQLQRNRLEEEKAKLRIEVMKPEEKNVSDKPVIISDQNICSNEKENTIPNYPTPAAVFGQVKSCTGKKLMLHLENLISKNNGQLSICNEDESMENSSLHENDVTDEEFKFNRNTSSSSLVQWTSINQNNIFLNTGGEVELYEERNLTNLSAVKNILLLIFVSKYKELLQKKYMEIIEYYGITALWRNDHESTMLRYGEFSPNNPKMRVSTQPYLGLGEYEQTRQLLSQQRKADYQQYAQKMKHTREPDTAFIKNNFKNSRPVSNSRDKAVQTDIQDVNSRLVQYDLNPRKSAEKEKSPRGHGVKIDKVQIETQNNIIIPGRSRYVDRTGSNRDNSPRAKLMADLQSSYFPTLMGYSPVDTEDEDKLEKVRRQEKYLSELRQQIEEKQRLVAKHKEQERREQETEMRRLDTQIREMNLDEKQSLSGHSYSVDLPVNSREFENKPEKPYTKTSRWSEKRYKPRMLESSLTHHSDPSENKYTSKHSLANSPTPSRRDKKPPYSFNIASNSVFANSLPVKDSVERQIHSNSKLVNHSDIGNSTTKLDSTQKRVHQQINTNKLDESLPIAVLKEPSPVAKELKNAVAVQSKTSDAMRKLEDKWQVPIVKKNIIKSTERLVEGVNNQGILTQLGAIRLQLQQEQLRLDETLRKRGTSQTVVHADVHHNLT